MAALVIDLCSSPVLPPRRPLSSGSISRSTLSEECRNPEDAFVTLSSDDSSVFNLSRPSTSNIICPITGTTAKPNMLKPPESTNKRNVNEKDFVYLSGDTNGALDLTELPSPKRQQLSTSTRASSSISASLKPPAPNIETSFPSGGRAFKKSRNSFKDDDILFTSSPDLLKEARAKRKQKRGDDSFCELDDDVFEFDALPNGRSHDGEFNQSSDEDLPDINAIPTKRSMQTKSTGVRTQPRRTGSDMALLKDNRVRAPQKSVDDKANCTKVKAQAEKDKEVEKEAERLRKAQAKEQKKKEKARLQELTKVNISKDDKKLSSPEMIVDLSSGLNQNLVEQVQLMLKPLDIESTSWEDTAPIVKWRRKVQARYSEEEGHWEPVAKHVNEEKHVLCHMTAKDFAQKAAGQEGEDIDTHVLHLKARFNGCKIIYLIEGLTKYMRDNENAKNRQYADAVRNQAPQEWTSITGHRKRKEQQYVDLEKIEEALLKLQIFHDALIHHTLGGRGPETAEWIVTFTQHISTIPYRAQKDSLDTAFCMDAGQVKSGEDTRDAYCKMLQEIVRITAPIALGIEAEYPTAQKLLAGLEKGGPLALEDCKKMANRNGAFTDRRIGPAISKRVHGVFTGRDPGSFDV